mgnify:CR=1 FL=1
MPKTTRESRRCKAKSEKRVNYKNRVSQGKKSKWATKPKDTRHRVKPTTEMDWLQPIDEQDEQEMREEECHMADAYVTWNRPASKSVIRYVIPGVMDYEELDEISRKHPTLFNYLFQ